MTKVTCIMCGKSYEVTPVDKDYDKIERGEKVVYVCEMCNTKVSYENREEQKKVQ